MRIVIVGDGKVGVTLTARLSQEGHDLVIIDNDKRVLRETVEKYDVLGVVGNGASLTVQQEAEVGASDLLIAATSMDEVNMLCCIVGRKLGVRRTIARVRNPEYTDQLGFLKEDLGLSMTINPERTAAMEILNLLRFPAALKRETFAKGRAEIIELKLRPGSPLNGLYLHDLIKLAKVQVLVCAVERGDQVYIPTGQFRLEEGDSIYVTGAAQNLASLVRKLQIMERKVRSVTMIGGSRIAFYLASALSMDGADVKIIEIDEKRCKELANLLPHARIIHADGAQPDILAGENFANSDALVTLTNIDEENMVLSMYGSQMGIPKVITKINSVEYNDIFRNLGVESMVSPKNIVCNDIVRYVRAMQNTSEDSVVALHRIVHDKVDALEFLATDETLGLGVKLRDLRLKPNVLLACLSRSGKVIIPNGNDFIKRGDSVIVVTPSDNIFRNLNEIFE
ncbi:MAG: Trk system potassium transporter TrkA [Provencibacterium sp.]|nr:Trk system potassium transporter TrkA [Provencibacterium sp.]